VERAKARRNGSNRYQNLKLLESKAQEATLIHELSLLAPFNPADLRLYQLMETFDWKYLPDDLQRQNAGLMSRLMNIKLAYQIADDFLEIGEKAQRQLETMQGFFNNAANKDE